MENEVSKKVCNACLKEKELNFFHKDRYRPDGYCGKCKECFKENRKSVKGRSGCNVMIICSGCEEEKHCSNFDLRTNRKRGFHYRCKTCRKNKILAKNKIIIKGEYKKCSKCLIFKHYSEFNKGIYTKYNIAVSCKECVNSRFDDPFEKLKHYIRNNIKDCFKRALYGTSIKAKNTEDILGCSFTFFMSHIESQFESWMNWNNYGNYVKQAGKNTSWNFEHIIPLCKVENEEDIYILNHWSNLMPMCSFKNFSKNCNDIEVYNYYINISCENGKLNKNK